jgi:SAM-dependent methyltransferase
VSSSPAAFSGSVPQFYDGYLKGLIFEPFAAELARRVPADARRVLEIACGTGIVTRRLREALPDAEIVATDLNEAMTSYARDAVPGNITWQVADAQELPFEDGSFDVAVCAFGFMFLPDRVKGFAETRRVLEPGGVLLGDTWHGVDTNLPAGKVDETLKRLFPDDPPTFLNTPYGYGDHGRIRADMEAAGWTDVELEDVTHAARADSAMDVAVGYARGTPLAGQLAERGADADAVIQAMADDLAALGGDRPFTSEHTATIITARR